MNKHGKYIRKFLKKLVFALVEIDGSGIHHNIPNAKFEKGKWEINALGFRGKEISLEKKDGQIRIACLGGSETFGSLGESKNMEWPSQLGELMSNRFPWVEVINISVIGLNAKKRKEYIEKYVLSLKPDIIIIYHQRFLIHVKETIRRSQQNFMATPFSEKKSKYKDAMGLIISKLKIIFRILLGRHLSRLASKHINFWRQSRNTRKMEKAYLTNQKPLEEVPDHIILEYENDLRLFVDYLKEVNVVPVFSTFPTLTTSFNKNIYKNKLINCRHFYCIQLSNEGILDAMHKINARIRRLAEEQNIILVDNDRLLPKTLDYFIDNFHYTDKGAGVVARNIFLALTQHGLLKDGNGGKPSVQPNKG